MRLLRARAPPWERFLDPAIWSFVGQGMGLDPAGDPLEAASHQGGAIADAKVPACFQPE